MKKQYSEQKQGSRALRIILFSFAMLLAFAPAVLAQSVSVRGTVTDSSGEPLAGVSVTLKGTSTGTATSADGSYAIVSPASGTLVFSYLGMTTREVSIDGRRQVDISMDQGATSMEDVIVVGYGTVKRQHLTGSVAVATAAEIKKSTVSHISQALVGKLPGIVSQQATGAPGSDGVTFLVRGHSSYTGSTPMYIVDGVERQIGNIDPNDIESVSVLKDAGTAAVYGMRAANGVILVTTKRGNQGKARVNYRGNVTLNHATTMPRMMNGTQYMQWFNLANYMELEADAAHNGTAFVAPEPYYSDEDIAATYNGDFSDGIENTNWMEQMQRTTVMHQHSLSIAGGSEALKYFISGGYLNQNGIVKGHKNQRGNFRSNIDATPLKNLKVSLNVASNVKDHYQPGPIYSYENWRSFNLFSLMMGAIPFVPKEYDGMPTSPYRLPTAAANPEFGPLNSGFVQSRNLDLETSANIEYTAPFIKGLKAGLSAAWDWKYYTGKSFTHDYTAIAYNPAKNTWNESDSYGNRWVVESIGGRVGGNLYTDGTTNQNVLLRPYLSFTREFGKSDVSALFLYEQTHNSSTSQNYQVDDFMLYTLAEIGLGTASTLRGGASSGKAAWASYVGRLNYAFDDKYLAEFAFRYDGSALFMKGNRWGFFPSLSLGWVLSREEFFKSALPGVEYFKLRASAGELGSTHYIAPFLYRKNYLKNGNTVVFGQTPTTQNTIVNNVPYPEESLTWERTRTTNLGFEMSAWNGLLGVEFDVFYKYTYNILTNLTDLGVYPASLGRHFPTRLNTGKFDNRGFELVLSHRNKVGNFNYRVSGNLTYARNRIISRLQSDNILPWQNRLGSSMNEIWGYKSNGLFQTEEELADAPLLEGQYTRKPMLGDIRYVDINGDGVINSLDQVKIARGRMPEMMFSLTMDGDWKGLDFSIQLQGAALADRMLQERWNPQGQSSNSSQYPRVDDQIPLTAAFYGEWDNTPLYIVENSWTEENRNAEFPRLNRGGRSNNAWTSDFWKRDASYLRLKNVTIGYTLPNRWTKRISVESLRVYASGQNLFTATEFKWIDPESPNVVTGYYPQQRTVSFGVDLSF
jgi:TonB-linked SusC/RagA family outer membrane protein